jgi:UDP-glucose 4-epimerase
MTSRRILITGVSSQLGGRLAQALERDAAVEAIVGIDATDPRHELQRTEFVRVETDPALLRRILSAASIDTVIDTRLVADPLLTPLSRAREINVIGTRRILAACAAEGSLVRKLVFKSSAHLYGANSDDPAFLTEAMGGRRPPRTALERDLIDTEAELSAFSGSRPQATVTILRFADALGGELQSSYLSLLNLPMVPAILGFDPRCQFIHEDDVVGALAHAARHDLPGVYNVAADGVLAFSEVVSLLGKRLLPVLPPWGTVFAAAGLRRLGLPVPLEMLRQLRSGRGLDNRRLKATGFSYRYTTREAVLKLRAHQRLRPLLGSGDGAYRYEREVEEFLRWSPSVQARAEGAIAAEGSIGTEGSIGPGDGQAGVPGSGQGGAYDDLSEAELIEIISSLETEALRRLRHYESHHGQRRGVLQALDRNLARRDGKRRG